MMTRSNDHSNPFFFSFFLAKWHTNCHLNLHSVIKLHKFSLTYRFFKIQMPPYLTYIPGGLHFSFAMLTFDIAIWPDYKSPTPLRRSTCMYIIGKLSKWAGLPIQYHVIVPKTMVRTPGPRARSDKSGSINWPSGSIGKLQPRPKEFAMGSSKVQVVWGG